MALGGLAALRLDRAGIALIGAIALVVSGRLTPADALSAIDGRTIALLLAMMVVSALLQVTGAFTVIARRLIGASQSPATLLAIVILVAGLLSAVFANNIVCLAILPLLIDICRRSHLDPVPYLLALACASNIGSAATLIGSPQTILIGQALQLSFGQYVVDAGPAVLAGLLVVWLVIAWTYRNGWARDTAADGSEAPHPATSPDHGQQWYRRFLTLIDWRLLVLFTGLFIVNHSVARAGLVSYYLMIPRMRGADLASPPLLFAATAALTSVVSTVPAVMLLLPAARAEIAGLVMALSSSFASNFQIVGSTATIAVVDQAKRHGYAINRRTFARIGTPVTLITLAAAALWLWFLIGMEGARP